MQFSQFSADEEIRRGVVLTHSARSGSNGTVCHAVSMSSKCWHLFALPCKFSSQPRHCLPSCAGCLASARIIALHRMSCKCWHLFCFVHRKFSSQPRHPVPRCAGCLASDRIFALHRKLSSEPGTVCRAVLDVLQVLASSHCTASFRHRNTLCRAVLDVLQVLASSRSTGRFHHSNTLCRAVLNVLRMLASSRSTGPSCHRKAPRAECVRTTPSRMCQNHSVLSQTKMFRLCLNVS